MTDTDTDQDPNAEHGDPLAEQGHGDPAEYGHDAHGEYGDDIGAAVETPRFSRHIDGFIWGTGRRKSSVARVRVKYGEGKIVVNGKDYREHFPTLPAQGLVTGPLTLTGTANKLDVFVQVHGGGITGQAGSCALGIGRALKELEPQVEHALREAGYLTRDSRMKERKKYGLRGARRAFQFSKR